jgi:pSer/pThr/pTyr-binding forkhead associated (FHA) protein
MVSGNKNFKEDRMAKLVQLIDGITANRFTLNQAPIHIGRGPGNDIEIDDLAVSARHAVIECDAEGCLVRDLGSTNGTFVNEEQVTQRRLYNRDVLRIGWSFFEFVDERIAPERTTRIRKTWIPGLFVNKR